MHVSVVIQPATLVVFWSSIFLCAYSLQQVDHQQCKSRSVFVKNDDVTLQCRVAPAGVHFTLLPVKDASNGLLYELRLDNGSLSEVHNLTSLSIQCCKLSRVRTYEGEHLTATTADKEDELMWTLANDSFVHAKNLEQLDLSFNNFHKLPEHLFCPLKKLKDLRLTHNKFNGFDDIGIVDQKTGHSCLTELEKLDLSYNHITQLSEKDVASLKNLLVLNLRNNLIKEVDPKSLSNSTRLEVVDLSSNQFTIFPSTLFLNLSELTQLHLANNSVSYLEFGLFTGLSKLSLLNLSYNQMLTEAITVDTFADLTALEVLHLNYNLLEKINLKIFKSQRKLRVLDLSYNLIRQINGHSFASLDNLHTLILSNNLLKSLNELTYPPKAVNSLKKLNTLNVANNKISEIENGSFSALQDLQVLILSGNQIVNLTNGSLNGLANLMHVDMSNNGIENIEIGVFDDAPNLRVIQLHHNRLRDIDGLFVNQTNLRQLNVSHNRITRFDLDMTPIHLYELDIQNNQIQDIADYYNFYRKSHLKYMNAAFNQIREMTAFSIPVQLETLILRNNNISVILPLMFWYKNRLKMVDLRNNSISTLDKKALSLEPSKLGNRSLPNFYISHNPVVCDCNMEWLKQLNKSSNYPLFLDLESTSCQLNRHASSVSLLKVNLSDFLCTYEYHCFTLCHCCDFDECDCEMKCPDNCTCYHDESWSTNIVDCSNKGHTTIPAGLAHDVTEMYFDGNDINKVIREPFLGRRKLRLLYLNNSNVRFIEQGTFRHLWHLKILHLEFNELTTLHGYEFESLTNLEELYLNHNQISSLNKKTFSNLKSLRVLHLENNEIIDYAIWELSGNSKLSALYLSHNFWTCDCEFMLTFHESMKESNFLEDRDEIRCYFNETAPGQFLTEFRETQCTNLTLTDG